MGLAILGAIPQVDCQIDRREESAGQVIEALRGIRLSVANRHGGAGPVVVTVTSPGRSDGKSFAASNLALAFADAGSRTLLIDGDVRRGRLHHVLNRHRRPGLTEILAGVVPLGQAIQGTSNRNLSFISCTTPPRISVRPGRRWRVGSGKDTPEIPSRPPLLFR